MAYTSSLLQLLVSFTLLLAITITPFASLAKLPFNFVPLTISSILLLAFLILTISSYLSKAFEIVKKHPSYEVMCEKIHL